MERIAKFSLAHVGEGYIYGAKGQTCTPAFRAQQAEQYPEWAENILGLGQKWDGEKVWDCAQLTRYAAKAAGLNLPSGATSQWERAEWVRTGEMDTLPVDEVAFLYRKSGGKMQHTGIYLGDGTCVHAAGTDDGVVHKPLHSYPWTHWAQLPPAEKEDEETVSNASILVVTSENGKPVNLRADASTKLPYIAKVQPGEQVEKLGEVVENGTKWMQIRAGDTIGYMQAIYLRADEETQAPAETVTIEIERGAAQQLMDALGRALGK